MSMIQTN